MIRRRRLGHATLIAAAFLSVGFSTTDAAGQSAYVLTTGRRLPYLYAISLDAALDPANDGTSNAIVSRSKVAMDRLDGPLLGDPANLVVSEDGLTVYVVNHHGAIDSEAACLRTQASHPEQPDPPIVSGKGKNFLKLRWTAPRGRGAVVAQYEVEIRDACKQARAVQTCHSNDAEAWGCGVQVFQGEGTKCEIKGLRPGTSLQARVRAFNAVGASQASAWVNVSTTATVPSAPPQPFVSEARIGQLLFGWQESEEDGGLEVNSYCLEVDECRGDDGFMVKYNGPARQWLLSMPRMRS